MHRRQSSSASAQQRCVHAGRRVCLRVGGGWRGGHMQQQIQLGSQPPPHHCMTPLQACSAGCGHHHWQQASQGASLARDSSPSGARPGLVPEGACCHLVLLAHSVPILALLNLERQLRAAAMVGVPGGNRPWQHRRACGAEGFLRETLPLPLVGRRERAQSSGPAQAPQTNLT